eukprot:TRINITY_DN66104_c0_g1_i1.p1 TRINITY_DN66104_c0_g1~~TRINITY_DN66104_c0_g1_i1.p1  ORF type:complete len:282 (+),score=19.19 TRINITY_DN66104_c0_g1_i1:70-846(+)
MAETILLELSKNTSPSESRTFVSLAVSLGLIGSSVSLREPPKDGEAMRRKQQEVGLQFTIAVCSILIFVVVTLMSHWDTEWVRFDSSQPEIHKVSFASFTGFLVFEAITLCTLPSDMWDWGSAVHVIAITCVYLFDPCPLLRYTGAACYVFEAATPFFKIWRFLTNAYPCSDPVIAGIRVGFTITFALSRLLIGVPASVMWWADMMRLFGDSRVHGRVVILFHLVLNFVLNLLNVFWFAKLLRSVLESLNRFVNKLKM